MRIQKTFTIVPPAGPATRTPVDNRPMTSKQVRKAYQAANRVPRVSRAELMRQERAEQERIRKEFEKEKAAAKAKLLREKKKAKEQAQNEEKKKKGLPLVTVRPSQDTIARFLRGNGSGNKRDCKGGDVDEATDAAKASTLPAVEELGEEEDEHEFPSPKRLCNKEEQNEEDGEEVEKEEEEREEESAPVPEESCIELDTALEKNELTAEGDFLDGFEIMSDDEISKLSFSEVVAKNNVSNTEALQSPAERDAIPVGENKGHLHDETTLHQSNSVMSIKNPEPMTLQEFDLIFDDEEDLELEMLALDVVLTSQQQLRKEPTEKKPLLQESQRPIHKTTGYEVDLGLDAGLSKQIPQATSFTKRDQTFLMPPPPIPTASRPSHSPISPVATKPQPPPLSTQQILFSMDDFFPTSSQQAAELEEEETTFISLSIKSSLAPKAQAPNPVAPKDVLPTSTLSSSPEPPKPFFTSSGSNERIAVALLRSRRTAEQEEEQRQRALRLEMVEFQEAKKKEAERRARAERLPDGKLKAKYTNHAASKMVSTEKGQVPREARQATVISPQFSARKRLVMNDNHTPVKTNPQRTPLVETNRKAILPDTKSPTVANMSRKLTSPGVNTRPSPSSFTSLSANKTLAPETKRQYSSPKQAKTPKVPDKENTTSPKISEAKCLMASQESEFGGSWMDELATELSL